jgi:two-component system, OmpR family, response regulator
VRWRCRQLGADAVFDKSLEIEALVAYCQGLRAPAAADAAPAASVPLGPPGAQAAA